MVGAKRLFDAVLLSLAFVCCVAAGLPAFAADLHVPGGYANIQAAITAAKAGDVIIVEDGRYTGAGNYNLDFMGKAITVRSENGPAGCILDGLGASVSAFTFVGGEKADSLLQGFTIQGFTNSGIVCDASSPTVSNCILQGNMNGDGAGMRCEHSSSPVIKQCVFIYNSVRGIFAADNSWPKIYDSVIQRNNWCGLHAETGAKVTMVNTILAENWYGVSAFDTSSLVIKDCMILKNLYSGILVDDGRARCTITNSVLARNGSAGIAANSSKVKAVNCSIVGNEEGVACGKKVPVVVNSIIWGNKDAQVSGSANITHSNVEGGYNGEGNMNRDPQFTNPKALDFHPRSSSPCIDKGNKSVAGLPPKDKNGRPRVWGAGVDMGAYELNSTKPRMQVVSVTATDESASEAGGNTGLLVFSRSMAAAAATNISTMVFGLAQNGPDYVKVPILVKIGANQMRKSVVVKPIADSLAEGVESVRVMIQGSKEYETALPFAIVRIENSAQ